MNYVKYFTPSWTGGGWNKRTLLMGNFAITLQTGKSDGWGRFGGGWNWCLGFEIGGTTLVLNLLICSVRLEKITDERKAKLLDKA